MSDEKRSLAVALSVARQRRAQSPAPQPTDPSTPGEEAPKPASRPFALRNPKLIAGEILSKGKPKDEPEAELDDVDEFLNWEDSLDQLDVGEPEAEAAPPDRKEMLRNIMMKINGKA